MARGRRVRRTASHSLQGQCPRPCPPPLWRGDVPNLQVLSDLAFGGPRHGRVNLVRPAANSGRHRAATASRLYRQERGGTAACHSESVRRGGRTRNLQLGRPSPLGDSLQGEPSFRLTRPRLVACSHAGLLHLPARFGVWRSPPRAGKPRSPGGELGTTPWGDAEGSLP